MTFTHSLKQEKLMLGIIIPYNYADCRLSCKSIGLRASTNSKKEKKEGISALTNYITRR